jgi:hypothetical protein
VLGAGTYYLVVDGKTPADDGTFALTVACSPAATAIACGATINDAPSGASRIDSWGCRPGIYAGPEAIYTFRLTSPQWVRASLSPGSPFDLFLVEQRTLGSPYSECLHTGDATTGAFRLGPGEYALVVDGPAAATGSYALTLDCQPQLTAIPINCGDLGGAGNNTGASLIDRYDCSTPSYALGEAYYRFQPAARVSATITNGTPLTHDVIAFRESDAAGHCVGSGDIINLVNLTPESHLLVVDSGTVAGATSLSVSCTNFVPRPLTCGSTIPAATGPDARLSRYTCLGRTYPGDEAYFLFDNPTTQDLVFAISGAPAGVNPAIAVFRGPVNAARADCLAGGTPYAHVQAAPPGEYLVVVDTPAGSTGVPLFLTTACNPQPPACAAAVDLACNGLVRGDTRTGAASAVVYGRLNNVFPGKELVYRLVNPVRQSVNILLRNPSDQWLDLILLDACDPERVVDYGDSVLIEPQLDPGTYYVVVDGRAGAEGSFELVTICGGPSLDPPVLTETLPPGGCTSEEKKLYFPTLVPIGDVLFSFDLSGSMDEELAQMKANARDIYTALNQLIPSLSFGIVSFVEHDYRWVNPDPACQFAPVGRAATPYPYLLHQPLTPDIALVNSVLQTLSIIGGALETYSWVFYQSYTDPNIGWRSCSRRVWVDFGDEVPMDCNVYSCIGQNRSTGRDPGPDRISGTADDLELIPIIDQMRANGIALIQIYSGRNNTEFQMWDCLGRRTGGSAFLLNSDGTIPDGTDVVDGLVGVIKDTLRPCPLVTLTPTGPYASWVTITPPTYSDVLTPFYGEFQVTFCVPPGTPAGTYSIPIEARCAGAGSCAVEVLGTQQVTLNVAACPALPVAQVAVPAAVCAGSEVVLDATGSSDCGTGPLEYRWLDGPTEICPWSTSPTCAVTPASSRSYTLEVRCPNIPPPAGPCTDAIQVAVTVEERPQPALLPLPTICAGDSITLDASASTGVGCSQPLQYRFRQGATVLQPWGPDPTHGPLLPAGGATYTVDVRCGDVVDCDASAAQTLAVVPPPAAAAGPDSHACFGTAVTLDGGGSSAGTCPGGLLYEWRQGTTVVRPASTDPTWNPPTTTTGSVTYTLVVWCAGLPGCLASDEVELTVDPCTLSVHFGRLAARRLAAGEASGVRVEWETLAEDRTAGFALERGPARDGPFASIALVTARGSGSSYVHHDLDAAVAGPTWYRLVELTDDGRGDVSPAFAAGGGGTIGSESTPGRGGRARPRRR